MFEFFVTCQKKSLKMHPSSIKTSIKLILRVAGVITPSEMTSGLKRENQPYTGDFHDLLLVMELRVP